MNLRTIFVLLFLAVLVVSACAPVPVTRPSIPQEDKPSLAWSPDMTVNVPFRETQTVIAYTFPSSILTDNDSAFVLKVAPYTKIQPNPEGLTPVGVVEIAPGSQANGPEAGVYEVQINLDSGAGQLVPLKAPQAYDVVFNVIPQIVNPDRINSTYEQFKNLKPAPDTTAAISADGVCFVVKRDDKNAYFRYCSVSGSILSVITHFPEKYKALSDLMTALAKAFDIPIQTDQIISEMEHPQHLNGCSAAIMARKSLTDLRSSCGSDIAVAPVTQDYFDQTFKAAQDQAGDGQFSVPVAVVQVFAQIETSEGNVVKGQYEMEYLYDKNSKFFAVEINALGTKSLQPVPGVPATFVNDPQQSGLTPQPGAQISTCRIFGACSFFQSSCS